MHSRSEHDLRASATSISDINSLLACLLGGVKDFSAKSGRGNTHYRNWLHKLSNFGSTSMSGVQIFKLHPRRHYSDEANPVSSSLGMKYSRHPKIDVEYIHSCHLSVMNISSRVLSRTRINHLRPVSCRPKTQVGELT